MNSIGAREQERQKEMEREMRKALQLYLGKWVKVHGVFRTFGNHPHVSRITALCDVQLIEDDGTRTELGHCWIQHASSLQRRSPRKGDGFAAECKVDRYDKKLDSPDSQGRVSVEDYSLIYPRHVAFDYDAHETLGEVNAEDRKESEVAQRGGAQPTLTDAVSIALEALGVEAPQEQIRSWVQDNYGEQCPTQISPTDLSSLACSIRDSAGGQAGERGRRSRGGRGRGTDAVRCAEGEGGDTGSRDVP